jgi:hypothetical protein
MQNPCCQAHSTGLLFRRHVACCVGLFPILLSIGCGGRHDNRTSIGGEGTLDGKPIPQGSITFLPMHGVQGSRTSGSIIDGRYRISREAGPAVGWNRVEINASRKTGKMIEMPPPWKGPVEETVEAVAPRYNSESTLKFEAKPGENTADFEVKSK